MDLRELSARMKATPGTKDARLAVVNEFRLLCERKYPEYHKEYDFPVIRAPAAPAADVSAAEAKPHAGRCAECRRACDAMRAAGTASASTSCTSWSRAACACGRSLSALPRSSTPR